MVRAAEAVRRRADLLASFATDMADRASETHAIADAAYREGAVELLYLLDARRTVTEIARLRSQAVFDYRLSWVDLETAVGRPLASAATRDARDWISR